MTRERRLAWLSGLIWLAITLLFCASVIWPLVAKAEPQFAVHSDDDLHRYFDGYTDEGGTKCCGTTDCPEVLAQERGAGYAFNHGGRDYLVPWSKRKPSPNRKFYACFRYDGSVRCFFAPYSGS